MARQPKPKQKNAAWLLALVALFGLPALAKAGNGEDNVPGADGTLPKAKDCRLPRGIRNNNPGNIRVSNANYLGKIPLAQNTDYNCTTRQVEKKYEQFVSYAHGVRALVQLLISDIYYRQGAFSVQEILMKYPTSTSTDQVAYIISVAKQMGVPAQEALASTENNIRALAKAIARFENGRDAITNAQYAAALHIAPIG